MDKTQALLEPHHGLAIRCESKVPGFDYARVHGADWNLMKAFALGL
jgi:hypothetical protein